MISFKEYLLEDVKKRHLNIFDMDGTLGNPTANVHVNDEHGKRVQSLDHAEFNKHSLSPNHSYDFSEFKDPHVFEKGFHPIKKMIKKFKHLQKKKNHDTIINTARSDFTDKDPVLNTLKSHGINTDKTHLHRAGNEVAPNTGEKKNVVVRRILDKGEHHSASFWDDDHNNLHTFLKLKREYPHVKFRAHHVKPDGSTEEIK